MELLVLPLVALTDREEEVGVAKRLGSSDVVCL